MSKERTAAASKARHLNALARKADEYAAGLRELGYTVIAPMDEDDQAPECFYEKCGCLSNSVGSHRKGCAAS